MGMLYDLERLEGGRGGEGDIGCHLASQSIIIEWKVRKSGDKDTDNEESNEQDETCEWRPGQKKAVRMD